MQFIGRRSSELKNVLILYLKPDFHETVEGRSAGGCLRNHKRDFDIYLQSKNMDKFSQYTRQTVGRHLKDSINHLSHNAICSVQLFRNSMIFELLV